MKQSVVRILFLMSLAGIALQTGLYATPVMTPESTAPAVVPVQQTKGLKSKDFARVSTRDLVAGTAAVLGVLTASTLSVGGNSLIGGDLVVGGNLTVNGTNNISSPSSGGSTPANSCAFFAYPSADLPTNPAGEVTIIFDQIVVNNGTVFGTPANTFVAPVGGKLYYLHCELVVDSVGSGNLVLLQKNGSTLAQASKTGISSGTSVSVNISLITTLAAGDQITIVYGGGGEGASTVYGVVGLGAYLSWFEGYQLN